MSEDEGEGVMGEDEGEEGEGVIGEGDMYVCMYVCIRKYTRRVHS